MLVALVIREILRPDRDLVRIVGDDDPSGGPLDDAPDRFTIDSLPSLVRPRKPATHGASDVPRPQTVPSVGD